MNGAELESASRCDRCGEVVADIDAGFSPGMHAMGHECGGRWKRVRWNRETGETVAITTDEEARAQ